MGSRSLHQALFGNSHFHRKFAENVVGVILEPEADTKALLNDILPRALEEIKDFDFKAKGLLYFPSHNLIEEAQKLSENTTELNPHAFLKEFTRKKHSDKTGHGHSLFLGYQALG